ncbi:MAG: superoxide dismutase [Anaerostipes sp.]|nr:superoxide dismutase [Anaerostipes sp.]
MNETYPFTISPLPYSYYALEPFLDHEVLVFHHQEHYAAYVKGLNATLKPHPKLQKMTLESLIQNAHTLPEPLQTQVIRNAGGVYNHQLYFDSMNSPSFSLPKDSLFKKLTEDFSSFDNFLNKFLEQCMALFGSGYVWLVLNQNTLDITSTPNQDTPLTRQQKPLLCIDLWEHAYYLQYQNRRSDYINNWFSLINWEHVLKLYVSAEKKS